ncbi:MAG: HD domain-containing phosphohydrolase [Clostridiales bacterium]
MNKIWNKLLNTFSLVSSQNDLKILFILILSFLTIFLIILIFLFFKTKKLKNILLQKSNLSELLHSINPKKTIDENFSNILKILSKILYSPTYSLYLFDEKKGMYILKSVSNSTDDSSLQASYSGLLPYKKEIYIPPLSLSKDNFTDKTTLINDGAVPLISLSTPNGQFVLRIGPIKKLSKPIKNFLDDFSNKLDPLFEMISNTEKLKTELQIYEKSSNALHNITNIVLNQHTILSRALKIYINSIEASSAFIIHKINDTYKLVSIESNYTKFKDNILNSKEIFGIIDNLSEEIGVSIISKSDYKFKKLPDFFEDYNFESIHIANATENDENLISVYLFENDISQNTESVASTIFMNTCKMCTIYSNYADTQELSNSYIEILKSVTEIIDSMSPNTIGYSELVSRYSIVISRELSLSYDEISKISLSAFLSEIGNIGFLDDLDSMDIENNKKAQNDYNKIHSEIGESIIKITLGDKEIASHIRHHHERIDGNGYPDGLRGDEIPLGSKIIAVAHSFVAKILGLHGNIPIPFDKAIDSLKLSSGNQLDSKIVEIFINWFISKQEKPEYKDRTLGSCWDMRCSPPEICYDCPAFKLNIDKCWECDDVKCKRHGNNCESCFIKSEFLSRKSLVNNYGK